MSELPDENHVHCANIYRIKKILEILGPDIDRYEVTQKAGAGDGRN
jgi:hypothetical protein